MTATSSMQRLWLAVLCLLAVAVVPCEADEPGAEVELNWRFYDDGWPFDTQQDLLDHLENIRSIFSPFKAARGSPLDPVSESGMDFELPSMLALTTKPFHSFTAWNGMLSSAQAIRLFQFNPWEHTGWITLADVQPPQVTTEYHQVVMRLLQTYEAWKSEADARLLESLNGPDDPGFFTIIEWELRRAGR